MKQTQHYTKTTIAILATLGLLSGCNWVDSAGRQSNSTPTIILDDGTPDDGFSININEEDIGVIDPSQSSDGDGAIVSWTWDKSTIASGALGACNSVDGFNASLAAQTLNEACTDSDECEVHVETEEVEKTEAEIEQDQASLDAVGSTADVSTLKTVFTLTAPKLRAPVGVTYRVVAKDNDGGSGFAEVTLCLVAINEAPEAVDDNFTVLEGVMKEVLATSPVNLLTNDIDDVDVSNKPLTVNSVAIVRPQHDGDFILNTDGGFNYYFAGDPSHLAGEETFDKFEYEISDGIHTSKAKVTLRIVSIDDAPVLISSIPDLTFYEGIAGNIDFGKYFKDPEGATLVFSESNNALPTSFDRVQLSKGFLQSKPKSNEVDQYSLVLSASDALSTTSDSVVLTIKENQRPSFASIANQSGSLGKAFALNIAKYTKDPEGQPLTYKLISGPSFFKINGSVLTGTPTTSSSWKVTVSVSDGYNTPAEKESFTFTVVNSAPVLTATIPDKTAPIGQSFTFNISSYFSDPEGQKLSYTLTSAPAYLSINGNGVISGTPSAQGTVNVTVQASDGEKAISDTFTLTTNNPAPVLVSKITDRIYTAGDVVSNVNIAQHFKDPNGEKLTFTASGLPASNQIKITASGVMSGSATTTDAGTYTITVTATDGTTPVKGTFKLTINKKPNTPPKLTTSGAGSTVTKGDAVSYTSAFSETDTGDALTITGTTGGSGLAFKQVNNTGVVSGTANTLGTFTIKVTAKDKSGASVEDIYTVKVLAANRAPTISKRGIGGTVASGVAVSYKTTFTDPDGDTLTMTSALGGSGLTAKKSGNTIEVSGTLVNTGSTAKTYTVSITAKDPSGSTVTDSYNITVNAAPVAANRAPSLSGAASDQVITNGQMAGNFVSSFTDPDAGDNPLTLTINKDTADFLVLQVSSNTATVLGRSNKSGVFNVVVTATDKAGLQATDSYTLTVNDTP